MPTAKKPTKKPVPKTEQARRKLAASKKPTKRKPNPLAKKKLTNKEASALLKKEARARVVEANKKLAKAKGQKHT